MSYKQGATRRYLAISGGYAEVLNDVMTVLTPTAEFGLEIDVNRARSARDIAEKRLNETNFEDKSFPVAQAAARRASARLQVAAKEGRR
jgi:F-type H+-transporting ATPase subunit epsilon